ncbi:MAG: DUF3990 domain-containing protein [Candidatus Symbiothrix sp.]|jgi:hypothetical protein|nr:DUF3990 domain-containing protein [Candidatus Symbiothrix sp.]
MKLYHGSTFAIEHPEIIRGKRFLDFGYGFYTTTHSGQASRWAKIKKERTKGKNSYLNMYEIADDIFRNENIHILEFDSANRSWLEFIIHNRRGGLMHNYDIVKGPVANDTLYQTFALYEAGILSAQETIIRLKSHELFNQLSFHTETAIRKLQWRETFII